MNLQWLNFSSWISPQCLIFLLMIGIEYICMSKLIMALDFDKPKILDVFILIILGLILYITLGMLGLASKQAL